MSRIFAVVLGFVSLVATGLTITSGAKAESANGFTFTVAGGNATVTGCVSVCPGVINIPATLNSYPVTAIGANAFYNASTVTVSIPNSVVLIGNGAFQANDISSLTIPNSVTTIGTNAFAYNQISTLSLGTAVESIGSSAFTENVLTTLVVPNSVITIAANAFSSNTISSLSLGTNVSSVGPYAFSENLLTSLVLPDAVLSVGEYAFEKNDLGAIDFGSGIQTIGSHAFADNSLTSITVPTTLTLLDTFAFKGNSLTSVSIPSTFSTISDYVFSENAISTLDLPSTITAIGDGAFYSNALSEVNLPAGLLTIGFSAFDSNLLTSLTIPESVTSIGNFAFFNNSISTLTIPASVTGVGDGAFATNLLTSVDFLGDAPTQGLGVFTDNDGLPYVVRLPAASDWGRTWSAVLVRVLGVTPPDTSLSRLGPTPSGENVSFVLTSDTSATFECNLDSAGWVACPSSYTTPTLSDGLHVLRVQAVDLYGVVDPTPARAMWRSDTTPPDTVLTTPKDFPFTAPVAEFSFSAVDDSPVTFECAIDDEPFAPCTSPYTTTTLPIGSHNFSVRATDSTGRVDPSPSTFTWEVREDDGPLPPTNRSDTLTPFGFARVLALLLLSIVAGALGVRRWRAEQSATR